MISRRQVLRGAGGAILALPFLPSLLTRTAHAAPPKRPPRLLWFTTNHGGAFESSMFPTVTSNQTMDLHPGHSISSGPLQARVVGNRRVLSSVLSAPTSQLSDRIVGKMNVLRGVDIPFDIGHHNGGQLGNYADNLGSNGDEGHVAQGFPRPTIDQIIGWSPSFYPDLSVVKERSMVMGWPKSFNYSNPGTRSGPIQRIQPYSSSLALFNSIFVPPEVPKRKPIIDNVLQSYKSLRESNRRLSTDDRRRLDDHIANLSELDRKLNAKVSCGSVVRPTDDADRHQGYNETDAVAWANLFIDVAIAAFVCGTSRVGVFGYNGEEALIQFAGDWHQDAAHQWQGSGQASLVAVYQKIFSQIFLRAAEKMDAIDNGAGGSLLDDTLMVWSQECGVSTHDGYSIPLVTFGSAAGALRTGMLCDYRRQNNPASRQEIMQGQSTWFGVTYNRFLATVLQSMGVGPSEFERWGHKGYGVPFVRRENPYVTLNRHYIDTNSIYFRTASDPLPLIWA